jgi:hypothetical protein
MRQGGGRSRASGAANHLSENQRRLRPQAMPEMGISMLLNKETAAEERKMNWGISCLSNKTVEVNTHKFPGSCSE